MLMCMYTDTVEKKTAHEMHIMSTTYIDSGQTSSGK